MLIGDLELFVIELPASDAAVRSLLVRVASETGLEGWGETRKPWRPAELPARRKSLLAALGGREAHDIESILALDVLADRALACGVEMALWDLVGQAARQPLCHLLGGAYRPSVPLAVRLPAGAVDNVAHWARVFLAQKIASQTISSTGDVEGDLKLMAALGEACSDRVRFRLDAGGRYAWRAAAGLCRQLAPLSVEFVVDPVSDGQAEHLASVHAAARVPLAAFQSVESLQGVMQLARDGTVAAVVVDPVLVGGLLRARACAAVADAGELAAMLRIEGTSGLAIAATLQVAAATPAFTGGHECSYPKLHDDILVEPLRMVDGMLAVPILPGLGVQVDRDKVDWYQVEG
jgi:L-alanine-DL-glutamate epimerase-like enolase superfamily enzyme